MRHKEIDILRGLAMVNIVLIHTAFWSGQQYIPYWFSNLTLLVDVPVFFFLAGSISLSKYPFKSNLKNTVKVIFVYFCFKKIILE